MIRIIICEDHPVVRNGLSGILGVQPDMEIAGLAENGLEAVGMLESGTIADIILADLNMPGLDGIGLVSAVSKQFPLIRTIILTMHSKAHFVASAREAGASGYILKEAEPETIFEVIRRVHYGERCFITTA